MSRNSIRQPHPEGGQRTGRSAAAPSSVSASPARSAVPAAQAMLLQRAIGNRRVGQWLGLSSPGEVGGSGRVLVQRSLDDSVKKKWNNDLLSALWVKMRDRSEGKDDMPGFAAKFDTKDAGKKTPRDILMEMANGKQLTERVLAEQIVEHPHLKPLFLNPRLHQTEDAVNIGGAIGDEAIKKVIGSCLFYHATFTKYVDAIKTGGLKASKGGGGDGVSTHGRNDADAQATYNKWSKGHVFITGVLSEAQGYRDKMAEKEPAQIIHVFSVPSYALEEGKVDIDSKAGLKFQGDMSAIGDGTTLNEAAQKVLMHAFIGLSVKPSVDDIIRVYAANFG